MVDILHRPGRQYVLADKGVGAATPKDGSIEAYRYAAADFKKPNLPRIDLNVVDFDAVCAETPAVDGEKRVAVLIDFGVEADSEGQEIPEPKAACAQAATEATGLQVLQSVIDVRTKPPTSARCCVASTAIPPRAAPTGDKAGDPGR